MAIQPEVWVKEIQETLLPESDFVLKSVSHNEFIDKLTVHIPQAGTPPTVVKNRTSLPSTIQQRTDTDRTYDLNEFSTDTFIVRAVDEIQTSYNKMQSLLNDHITQLRKRIGDETANTWAGATLVSNGGQIVLTTGSDTANIAPPTGTGNRKALKLDNWASAAAKLDNDDVEQKNRWCLIPATMYHNMLIENKAELLSRDFMLKGNLPDAVVANIWGFNIIVRSNVVVYDNTATPILRPVGFSSASDDNFGAICWQSDQVANAMGATRVFSQENVPEFYADALMSAVVMHGSIALRTDGRGIVTIVQDT